MNADGSYAIPDGNLFAPGTDKTRPEIYAMGFRNPFRFSVDKTTGILYVGDYGPDAGAADPTRGPAGQVEFARVTEPGNFGWPYCTGDNDAYVDYDFATGTSGAAFDCAAPKNTSPQQHRSHRPAPGPGRLDPLRRRAPCRSSAAAPSPRWAARSTTTTPRSTRR